MAWTKNEQKKRDYKNLYQALDDAVHYCKIEKTEASNLIGTYKNTINGLGSGIPNTYFDDAIDILQPQLDEYYNYMSAKYSELKTARDKAKARYDYYKDKVEEEKEND